MPNLTVFQTQTLVPENDVGAGGGLPAGREFLSAAGSLGGAVASAFAHHEEVVSRHEEVVSREANAAAMNVAAKIRADQQIVLDQAKQGQGPAVVMNPTWQGVERLIDVMRPTMGDPDLLAGANTEPRTIFSADAYEKQFRDVRTAAAAAVPPRGRKLFDQMMDENFNQLKVQASQYQLGQQQSSSVSSTQSGIEDDERLLAADYNQYDVALAKRLATINSLPAEQSVRDRLASEARSRLALAASQGVQMRNPKAALAALNRYFNVPDAPNAAAPASPLSGAPESSGQAAPSDLTAAQAASDAARFAPDRIPVLQAEIANPATTPASGAALQSQIDEIRRRSTPAPAESVLSNKGAADFIDAAGGRPGDAVLPFFNALEPRVALELRNRALAEVQRGQAGARASLDARAKDYQSMVMSGAAPPASTIPTAEEYAQAFGEEGARRYATEVDTYTRLRNGLVQLQGASWADRQAVIARYAPTPGEGFDQAQRIQGSVIQANALIEKQIAADPAAYAMRNSPRVQQAASAMQAAPNDPAAVDAFALATTAEQERLGVRQLKADALGEGGAARQLTPRLLTNGQANALAQMFHTSGANAAQIMDGLQTTWGGHFPEVFAQLAQDDKIPPAALVIPNMSDPYAKETLARYSDPKLQKDMVENLPAGATKDINAALQQANEPFFNSLAFQQGGQRTFDTVLQQQRTLAGVYVMQGRSPADAARIAFEQTVGHQYVFADSLRIPKNQQPDLVQSGLGTLQMAPETLHATPPPSYRPGLTAKARDAAWLDAIKSNATWVANADESGATLVVRGRTDAGADVRYPVPGPDGKTPMSWTWAQLRAIGMDRHAKARSIFESNAPAPSLSGGGF